MFIAVCDCIIFRQESLLEQFAGFSLFQSNCDKAHISNGFENGFIKTIVPVNFKSGFKIVCPIFLLAMSINHIVPITRISAIHACIDNSILLSAVNSQIHSGINPIRTVTFFIDLKSIIIIYFRYTKQRKIRNPIFLRNLLFVICHKHPTFLEKLK